MTASLLTCSAADYYSGAFDTRPAFSQSLAKVLLQRSPEHVFRAHPKLGGKFRVMTDAMRLGSLADAATFGGLGDWEILDADTWRGGLSKRLHEARMGERVCLEHEAATADREANRVLTAVARLGLTVSQTQLGIAWEAAVPIRVGGDMAHQQPTLCCGRPDAVDSRQRIILDLKRTRDANPRVLDRHIARMGWHIQAAAYTEAMREFTEHEYRHVIIAVDEHDVVPREIAGEYLEAGRRDWHRARIEWAQCLMDQHWPGYVDAILPAEMPRWMAVGDDDDVEGFEVTE